MAVMRLVGWLWWGWWDCGGVRGIVVRLVGLWWGWWDNGRVGKAGWQVAIGLSGESGFDCGGEAEDVMSGGGMGEML